MKILTANRLSDGEVVWLAEDRAWIESIGGAAIAHDRDEEAALQEAGDAALANNEVVDVSLIDVEIIDGSIRPIRLRERIRAAGPTTHTHFGKQARTSAPHAV